MIYTATANATKASGVYADAFVVHNLDPANSIYLGSNSSLTPGTQDYTLGPGEAIPWPDTTDLWTVTDPGLSAPFETLVGGTFSQPGNTTINGDVSISGTVPVDVQGTVAVNGDVGISGGSIDISGPVTIAGDVSVDGSTISVGNTVEVIGVVETQNAANPTQLGQFTPHLPALVPVNLGPVTGFGKYSSYLITIASSTGILDTANEITVGVVPNGIAIQGQLNAQLFAGCYGQVRGRVVSDSNTINIMSTVTADYTITIYGSNLDLPTIGNYFQLNGGLYSPPFTIDATAVTSSTQYPLANNEGECILQFWSDHTGNSASISVYTDHVASSRRLFLAQIGTSDAPGIREFRFYPGFAPMILVFAVGIYGGGNVGFALTQEMAV